MKILHYSLGTPPHRSGGLTNWSMSLMNWQVQNGHEVSLMFPGSIGLIFNRKMKIKKIYNKTSFPVYELINPLPIPLIYAIDSDEKYIAHAQPCDFLSFFKDNSIEILHIHTLMGLPLTFLTSAKQAGVKIIYTAHDVFGVWPNTHELMGKNDNKEIYEAGYIGNQKVLSYLHIVVMQSRAYRYLKNSRPIIRMRKYMRSTLKSEKQPGKTRGSIATDSQPTNENLYGNMRTFYSSYFDAIDLIHYGSNLTKTVFERCGINNKSFVKYVYHDSIPKKVQPIDNYELTMPIKILYAGTPEAYKGFDLLICSLDRLDAQYPGTFKLVTYSLESKYSRAYIDNREPYKMRDISKVYGSADITIVPSLCLETFGLVVAESMSYGCPVMVSESVGAKELIENSYGYVFSGKEDLMRCLRKIINNSSDLEDKRRAIASSALEFDSDDIMHTIVTKYNSIKGNK